MVILNTVYRRCRDSSGEMGARSFSIFSIPAFFLIFLLTVFFVAASIPTEMGQRWLSFVPYLQKKTMFFRYTVACHRSQEAREADGITLSLPHAYRDYRRRSAR